MTGQVKAIDHKTPIICGDYDELDLSLGVMRNGVGSMSSQDVPLYVTSADDVKKLKEALQSGKIVELTYDERRVTFCVPDRWVTGIKTLE